MPTDHLFTYPMLAWAKSIEAMRNHLTYAAAATITFIATTAPSLGQPQAATPSFECVANRGVPTTIVITPEREVPLIEWTSDHFSNDGWTPEARCRDVTSRIKRAYQAGSMNYFTTGRVNRMPVICSTSVEGGSCEALIYTLKPNQNPAVTLEQLLKVRSGKRGPISETTSRPYIPMSNFISNQTLDGNNIGETEMHTQTEKEVF